MTWPERSACFGADTELFYPDPSDHEAANALINTYCRRCETGAECAAEAANLRGAERCGIWGGRHLDSRSEAREPVPYDQFTRDEIREAVAAHNRHLRGIGPGLTERQLDARRAHERELKRRQRDRDKARRAAARTDRELVSA